MHGVVSLLDDEHYALVEEVWQELSEKFGVRGIYATPFPHFTYQVSEEYDAERVERALRRVAARTHPFKVRTGGLGIFCLAKPVLYVPLVRAPALEALHERIWEEIASAPTGEAAKYYDAAQWLPHVTLAQGDIDRDQLAEVVRALAGRDFHWDLEVNNLSLIYDTGAEQGLRCRFNFATC
ncbi:MAG TPA: 2'-5' RNA ligase family protein [Pyrinomonadaceae bacterium]|nr:2'-5' RNA ligase family protein [Pyrinomonadaceae bacterium]